MIYEGTIEYELNYLHTLVIDFSYTVTEDETDEGEIFPVMDNVQVCSIYLKKNTKLRNIKLPSSLDLKEVVKYIKEHYENILKDIDEADENSIDYYKDYVK